MTSRTDNLAFFIGVKNALIIEGIAVALILAIVWMWGAA